MIEDPERFRQDIIEASRLGRNISVRPYDKIVFCGIGGSAVTGEIIQVLKEDCPVFLVREKLPGFVDKRTLVFIVSYSGNTKETLKLYREAKKKTSNIVIITSGGRMKRLRENKIIIPAGYLPRESFVYLSFPALNILGIKINSKKLVRRIDDSIKKEAKRIASRIRKKIPVIFSSSEQLRYVAYRWKICFNENAKTFAHSNFFPEISHNEIEGRLNRDFVPVLLYDKKSQIIEKTRRYLKYLEIKLKGESLFEKIIYGIYLGYLVSVEVAKLKGYDFRKIERIESLKK